MDLIENSGLVHIVGGIDHRTLKWRYVRRKLRIVQSKLGRGLHVLYY